MSTVNEVFGFGAYEQFKNPKTFYCGLELEIEDIQKNNVSSSQVSCKEDGSLRNGGLEFITTPVTYEDALSLFKYVHGALKLGKNPFSERTSIHVHVNCLGFEVSTLRELVLTYALAEPLFFNFVGHNRQNSVFCVPLNHTPLPGQYAKDLIGMHKSWHKYTAFNISPLGPGKDGSAPHGTIEFRHMYGTGDFEVFKTWLTAIKDLFDFYAFNPEFKLINYLKENKSPYDLLRDVLPTLTLPLNNFQLKEMTKDTLLDVQLSDGGLVK